ncbi:MAG: hypothetical protein ACFE89_13110 [Candidatus Hodarchaeota archaeon]
MKLGELHIESVWEYGQDCEFFELRILPKFMRGKKPVLKILHQLKKSPVLGASMNRLFLAPSATHFEYRGMAMMMLSDDDLSLFVNDNEFKDYTFNNLIFAEWLGPLRKDVSNPIIFWLAKSNPPGCKYILEHIPITHHVIQLGKSYSIHEVVSCVLSALKSEDGFRLPFWFEKIIGDYSFR